MKIKYCTEVEWYIMPGLHNLQLVLISKFSQNFILKTHMLCFSRHSRQKCRKSRFLEQNNKNAWLPHLYNLLQPGSRKQHKYTSKHEYRYWALRTEDWELRIEGRGPRTENWGLKIENWGLRIEDWGVRSEECWLRSEEWGQLLTFWVLIPDSSFHSPQSSVFLKPLKPKKILKNWKNSH